MEERERRYGTTKRTRERLQMMMMMGLGRPKIRNDGSFSPGPRSSSRSHTTTPCSSSSFCFHLLSSFSYQGIIITTLLHPADAHPSVPPSGDHEPLFSQLNASQLCHTPQSIIVIYSMQLFLVCPFPLWPISPLAFCKASC